MSKTVTRNITINGKTYPAKEFDFNLVCDMQEMGISLQDAKKSPMPLVRAYAALCMGGDKDAAGAQLEEHFANGGSLEELVQVMGEKMENSDFFHSLTKTAKKEAAED